VPGLRTPLENEKAARRRPFCWNGKCRIRLLSRVPKLFSANLTLLETPNEPDVLHLTAVLLVLGSRRHVGNLGRAERNDVNRVDGFLGFRENTGGKDSRDRVGLVVVAGAADR